MFRFQLEVAIALVASAFSSLVFRYFNGKKAEGTIQLPVHVELEEDQHDPFDVTRPEDVVHGYPLGADIFWTSMRRRKLLISSLLALAVVISSILLGWSVADELRQESTVYFLHLVFALYLFLLGARSVRQDDADIHTNYIIHLSSLSTFGFLLLGGTVILPESPPPFKASDLAYKVLWRRSIHDVSTQDFDVVLRALWYILVLLHTFAWILIIRTPLGPPLHYPASNIYSEKTVKSITNKDENNVCGIISGSPWDLLLFSYTTKVVWLGNTAESLDIGDLPIVPADMRATFNYDAMRRAMRTVSLRFFSWNPKPGSGWQLSWKLVRLNSLVLTAEILLAAVSALLFYSPAFFLRRLVAYLEVNPGREEKGWGWVYVIGLFVTNGTMFLISGQLWSLATTIVQCRLRIQLNSTLFAKSLVRKDVASSAPKGGKNDSESGAGSEDENDFSTKAQIMTLMTTDVDRVSDFSWHLFTLVDAPIEAVIGTLFLYDLLGVSCFFGLAAILPFLPLNHFAGKVVVAAQDNLMKARDERISLMNEILGAIRMVKFMAWERSFEKRVLAIREKELKYQRLNFSIEALWSVIWNGSPILVTLISFWHFAIVRQQSLTPSIAFTSILVFGEMKFALSALPETFINMLQSFVSLRRIEKYLNAEEVKTVPPLDQQSKIMAFQSCTITWPQDRGSTSKASSASSTPQQKFRLVDLNLDFPRGGLTLVCGKLGSGKTLLLLALLGEAEVLAGQVLCPRSPPDSLASFVTVIPSREDWVVEGLCAYVPQTAWLRNASIKENILFNLPYDEERYSKTLEVCALISDLEILEDGDEAEIGERGVNLSGGQKARVSLARAVYSRASILLLDDVLSAVDAHTADHLYNECLKGELMEGRTVILVSHHVRLCVPGASYVVALDNGRVQFHGSQDDFYKSGVIRTLIQSTQHEEKNDEEEDASVESTKKQASVAEKEERSESGSTVVASVKQDKKPARKLIEEEKRAVGRIGRNIWETYFWACGQVWYWVIFAVVLLLASLSPVVENSWLRHWSNSELKGTVENPGYYISVYAILTAVGLVIGTIRWFILYHGSIRASHVLYRRLLETVLFANIRFHDTISRGRLLNRFGKDFEGIDSSLSDNFGRTFMNGLSAVTTIITISVVGGLPFISITAILSIVYWNVAKVYGQTSRDMRRLDSVSRSPLYSIYGETISGVTIVRAFGASSKFLRDMLRFVDTNANPYYWMWGVNRWLSVRFNLLSAGIVGATGLVCLITPGVSASLAGFALSFASTITMDLLWMVRRFVALEQSMVAMERVKEYTDLEREPPEFMEPRPDPTWPPHGEIKCENLVIRYAPELPDVLHHINFEVHPGEKVGILGRTGSGKSTLALSFFRFVEATEGRILIDGIDISTIGLADLRSRLTIIPQDPIILSGTLRSTLDVFDEYQDAEIYEALRRVHLIPSDDTPGSSEVSLNVNVFKDLDNTVSEGGDNLSTGEKQLLCMARAILKRSRVLVMDEATASVDYATDELIGRTIRHEFAESTILTIAHRLRTVIDYDRVLLLEQGRIIEFDKPSTLLSDPSSKFSALCKATGRNEYATLKQLAGISDQP